MMLPRSQLLHFKSVAQCTTKHLYLALNLLTMFSVLGGCPTALHMHTEVSLYVM